MRTFLGNPYCEGLYPSAVGFDRCIYLLLTDQASIHLLVVLLVFVGNPRLQLLAVVVCQSIFFVIQFVYLRAESRHVATRRLVNCACYFFAVYFKFSMLFETIPFQHESKYGWCFISLLFVFLVISYFQMVTLSL